MDKDLSIQTGLSESTLDMIRDMILSMPEISQAIIFGSRAKGTWKEFSDIDISLKGNGVTHQTIVTLINRIDDLNLPYIFDFNRYDSLTNPLLREHIDRVGIPIL